METNGTIDPEEAIRRAATILAEQLEAFVDLRDVRQPEVKEEKPEFDLIRRALLTIWNRLSALLTALKQKRHPLYR
ncbi:hypothetical protein ACLB1M_26185 [Escherichia coli]